MKKHIPNSKQELWDTRFSYNGKLELVMLDFFGKYYWGMARLFRDPKFCKKCMLRLVKRMRKRLNEILTMDERLRQRTNDILESLENHAKQISIEKNNDWDIIADLLHLIAHLLGYDWQDGKIHRQVFYYQDEAQAQLDKKIDNPRKYYDSLRSDEKLRYMLVQSMRNRQLPKHQIARLLGISSGRVNKIILHIEEYEKEEEKPFPEFLGG